MQPEYFFMFWNYYQRIVNFAISLMCNKSHKSFNTQWNYKKHTHRQTHFQSSNPVSLHLFVVNSQYLPNTCNTIIFEYFDITIPLFFLHPQLTDLFFLSSSFQAFLLLPKPPPFLMTVLPGMLSIDPVIDISSSLHKYLYHLNSTSGCVRDKRNASVQQTQ